VGRERRGRLNANRAALGIDGGAKARAEEAGGGKQKERERERGKRNRRESNPSTAGESGAPKGGGYDFGDLDAELDRLKRRSDREKRARASDDLLVKTYEGMYAGFEMMASVLGGREEVPAVRFGDVPWLPVLETAGAGGAESWRTLGVAERAPVEEKKAALRRETMRWHPDRFAQKFGRRLDGGDRERVLEAVVRVAQRINAFRVRFDGEVRKEEEEREKKGGGRGGGEGGTTNEA